MKTIFKYPIKAEDFQTISMPDGAEVLAVQVQKETPCIWAMVDIKAPYRDRVFRVIGTGQPCDDFNNGKYMGTFQMINGSLVFHLFDLGYIKA